MDDLDIPTHLVAFVAPGHHHHHAILDEDVANPTFHVVTEPQTEQLRDWGGQSPRELESRDQLLVELDLLPPPRFDLGSVPHQPGLSFHKSCSKAGGVTDSIDQPSFPVDGKLIPHVLGGIPPHLVIDQIVTQGGPRDPTDPSPELVWWRAPTHAPSPETRP